VADDIRSLSAALARDPASLHYVDLAEALRRRGKLSEALQCVVHGLGRHPEHADGYDCLARIHSDLGDMAQARSAWERALAIVPEHIGALKGIGFLYYRQGETKRATDALEHALAASPDDEAVRRALETIRSQSPQSPTSGAQSPQSQQSPQEGGGSSRTTRPIEQPLSDAPRPSLSDFAPRRTPADVPQLRATASALLAEQIAAADAEASARESGASRAAGASSRSSASSAPGPSAPPPEQRPPVFAGLEGATADILLLDARGLVMAGGLKAANGADVSELAAAALAGVSGEATRTVGYLGLGAWSTIVAEAEHANVVLSGVGEGAMLMLRRDRSTPVGLAARIAERARQAAATWLAAQI
jgi:tetratricopeptide (TPR) repeat protein